MALDVGMCGILYLDSMCAKTTSTAPGTFIEVPCLASNMEACAAFCDKLGQPEAYMDWNKTEAFIVM